MKNRKRYIALFLALCILLNQSVLAVSAGKTGIDNTQGIRQTEGNEPEDLAEPSGQKELSETDSFESEEAVESLERERLSGQEGMIVFSGQEEPPKAALSEPEESTEPSGQEEMPEEVPSGQQESPGAEESGREEVSETVPSGQEEVPEEVPSGEEDSGQVIRVLRDRSITGKLRILQGADRKPRSNRSWCNGEFLAAEWKENSVYADRYDTIRLRRCEGVHSWEELVKRDWIREQEDKGSIRLEIEPVVEETYYEILLTNEENPSETVIAAVIRMIPEAEYNADAEVPEAADGCPVLTFGYDGTAPEVRFEEESLNRIPDTDEICRVEKYLPEITFEIENQGFEVDRLEYAFVNVEEWFAQSIKPTSGLTSLQIREESRYTVQCPVEDGDYVLYVRTANAGGTEKEFISNSIFADQTAPDISSVYTGKEHGEEFTDSIEHGKEVYTNQTMHVRTVIREAHLAEVTVSITAKELDEQGREQDRAELAQALRDREEKLEQTLRTDQAAEYDFEESGRYRITITAVDQTGLSATITQSFTVDRERPDRGLVVAVGSIHDRESGNDTWVKKKIRKKWDRLFDTVADTLFSQEEIPVILEGSDRISSVAIYYYITDQNLTEETLEKIDETDWIVYSSMTGRQPVIRMNQRAVLYEKVVDQAGNTSYFSSEGMITDNQAPVIELQVEREADRNGFYRGDIPFSVYVEDRIPEGGTGCTGLRFVSCRIGAEGTEAKESILYESEDGSGADPYSLKHAVISAEQFHDNHVILSLTAVDRAGNKRELTKEFHVDTTAPVISVQYGDEQGGKYYNRERTAIVTIRERNLDPSDVQIAVNSTNGSPVSIGSWTHSPDAGESDSAVHTCRVVFSEDDDYRFTVNCMDQAGNRAKGFTDTFTIDRTKPVIAVRYEGAGVSGTSASPDRSGPLANLWTSVANGRVEPMAYYNTQVTVTVTIVEHNFHAEDVVIGYADGSMESGGEGETAAGTSAADRGGGLYGTAGFYSNGDVHTAVLRYRVDGEYALHIAYTDPAGNAAESYSGAGFTIDCTSPQVAIANVEDQSSNRGEVAPVITCTDANYDREQVSVVITGAKHGAVVLERVGFRVTEVNGGQQFCMDFPEEEELDDQYTLTVKLMDRAGNQVERSIRFSVNRYGSVYTLSQETGTWLTNGECAYIKEGRSVVLIETNTDPVVGRNLSYTTGGVNGRTRTIHALETCSQEEREQGMYYKCSDSYTTDGWYQYRYEICGDLFDEEGYYTIQIDTTDRAGNHTGNAGNRLSPLRIQFAVDRTAPSVVVTGARNGQICNEEKHTLWLDVQDNVAMDSITVYVNGEVYIRCNAHEPEQIDRIPVEVGESLSMQTLQVEARDMAGNVLGSRAGGSCDSVFEDFTILVTRNAFARFLHRKWMVLCASIVIVCGVTGGICFRRKRNSFPADGTD